jgi:hypothetical protein
MPRACCRHPIFPRRAGPKCSHFVLGNSICELIGLLNLKYWCYFLMTTPAMDSVTASHTGLLTSCTRLQEFRSHRLGLRRLRPGQRRQLHSNLQPHHARPRLLHKRRPGTLPQQGPGALGRCPHDQRHLPAALRQRSRGPRAGQARLFLSSGCPCVGRRRGRTWDRVELASGIDGQMGQARWVSTGTARKSTALARHKHDTIVLVPARGTI